jgi:hypothetical protein
LVEGWPEAMGEKDQLGNTPLHVAAWMTETEVVRILVERWPEGKKSFNNDGKTPLRRFENGDSRRRWRLSDEEKEEIIALLGGPYSEANND